MEKENFLKLLSDYDRHFRHILMKMEGKESTLGQETDRYIICYCGTQLKLAEKVVPEYLEISAHLARCFMEIQYILKWLKSDPKNYNAFIADAEHAQLDLVKSKRDALKTHAPEHVEKFEKMILEGEEFIKKKGYDKYNDARNFLFKVKKIVSKIESEQVSLFNAKFDFFSKMSHPTAWLITRNAEEDKYIKSEAMAEINKSIINILNTLDEYLSV